MTNDKRQRLNAEISPRVRPRGVLCYTYGMLTSIRMSPEIDEDPFAADLEKVAIPWPWIAAAFVALFLFIPVGLGLHLCALDWGARYFGPSPTLRLVEGFVLTLIVVQLVAAWPLTAFLYPELIQRRGLGLSGLALGGVIFFGPPLAAFIAFVGDVHTIMDAYDVFSSSSPPWCSRWCFTGRRHVSGSSRSF